jgi:hypothetical protein
LQTTIFHLQCFFSYHTYKLIRRLVRSSIFIGIYKHIILINSLFGKSSGKTSETKQISSDSSCFLLLFRLVTYLWDPVSFFAEMGEVFFLFPFPWDPVFIQNWPVFIPFSSSFQSIWDISKNWYVHKPTNHQLYMLTYGLLLNIGPITLYVYIICDYVHVYSRIFDYVVLT